MKSSMTETSVHGMTGDLFGYVPPVEIKQEKVKSLLASISNQGVEQIKSNELRLHPLAKAMYQQMFIDLGLKTDVRNDVQLGHEIVSSEQRQMDTLIWIYDLNPSGSDFPFESVCETLRIDPEIFRRVIARNMKSQLRNVVALIASMVSYEHAKTCELNLSDYANVSGWNLN